MKRTDVRRRALGFVLQELLLAVAIVSVIAAVSLGVYTSVRDSSKAEEQAQVMVDIASNVRRVFGKAQGNYTGVTAARVSTLGLVRQPLRWNGTNLQDAWGNTMTIYGSGPWMFSMTAGGGGITAVECAALATRLAITAASVRVGTTAAVSTSGATDGWVLGGHPYKANNAFNQANLTTGCSESNAVVGATFLER
jgi:type II secretory pathway pseudopilin PulG